MKVQSVLKKLALPKSFTTNPRLTKTFITLLIIVLPLGAFFIGKNYKEETATQTTPNTPISQTPKHTFKKVPLLDVEKEMNGEVYSFRRDPEKKETDQFPLGFFVGSGDNAYAITKGDYSAWITSLITEHTYDFWFIKADNTLKEDILFTVEGILSHVPSTDFEVITKFPISSQWGSVGKGEVLYQHDAGVYARTQILDYFPEQQILLLKTNSGDGCGGDGTIWKLNTSGRRTDLSTYAFGCALNETTPQYVGYVNKKLYFNTMKADASIPPPIPFSVATTYSLDPLTQSKEIISSLPEELKSSSL